MKPSTRSLLEQEQRRALKEPTPPAVIRKNKKSSKKKANSAPKKPAMLRDQEGGTRQPKTRTQDVRDVPKPRKPAGAPKPPSVVSRHQEGGKEIGQLRTKSTPKPRKPRTEKLGMVERLRQRASELEVCEAAKKKFAVGDRVKYTGKWLRNTGQQTGPAGRRKGTIKDLKALSGQHVLVHWDGDPEPVAVHPANLMKTASTVRQATPKKYKVGDKVQYGDKGKQKTYEVIKVKPNPHYGGQSLTIRGPGGTIDNVSPGLDSRFEGNVNAPSFEQLMWGGATQRQATDPECLKGEQQAQRDFKAGKNLRAELAKLRKNGWGAMDACYESMMKRLVNEIKVPGGGDVAAVGKDSRGYYVRAPNGAKTSFKDVTKFRQRLSEMLSSSQKANKLVKQLDQKRASAGGAPVRQGKKPYVSKWRKKVKGKPVQKGKLKKDIVSFGTKGDPIEVYDSGETYPNGDKILILLNTSNDQAMPVEPDHVAMNVASAGKKPREAAAPKKIDRSLRTKIVRALNKAGLDGNGRFEKPGLGLTAAMVVLGKFGIEQDELPSSHHLSGDKGMITVRLAWSNEQDAFSPQPIPNTQLVFSFYKLDKYKYECLAYLS